MQLVLIICGIGSLYAWSNPSTSLLWGWRLGLGAGIIACSFLWYRWAHLKENLPDLLAKTIGSYGYFERDGLCFAPVVELVQRVCRVAIFFQNRYANPCYCLVEMLPPARSFWFGRHNLPPIKVVLHCPGGGFGVTRFPYAVPEKYQGRQWRFDVIADTKYPQGQGQMLRFRAGIRTASNAVFTISSNSRSFIAIYFPRGVSAALRQNPEPTMEIIWQPDLPTNAFPVIPTAEIAGKPDIGFPVNPHEPT